MKMKHPIREKPSWIQYPMFVIQALKKERQANHEFETNLTYLVRPWGESEGQGRGGRHNLREDSN